MKLFAIITGTLLGAVQFVCGNKREIDLGYHIDFNLLCKLLSLYTPSWLAEYINDAESYLNFNISYEQLMQLTDMGYMQELSPKRIAQILPGYICIRSSLPKGKDTFNSDLLLKREITLKEHIWYLFEQESSIGYHNDRAQTAYKEGTTSRMKALAPLSIVSRSTDIWTETDFCERHFPPSTEVLKKTW